MSEGRLDGKAAIVTGSASGIGAATARLFAAEGASVTIADINAEGGREVAAEIEDAGGTAAFVETDVTDAGAVSAMVDRTVERFGSVDVLMNNAGGAFGDGRPHEVTEEAWEENVGVNLKGAFLCTRETLPAMIEGGGGSVMHTSSVNGLTGLGLTSYSAAKGGLIAMSKVVANQYGRYGVRSNAICPGEIDTEAYAYTDWGDEVVDEWIDQFPLGRFGEPEDVANVALFLASDESAYVTGTEIVVDGGMTAGPDHSLEQILYDVEGIGSEL